MLLSSARNFKPSLAPAVASRRLGYLRNRVAKEPAIVVATLERTYQESPEMQAGAAALYWDAYQNLIASNPDRAGIPWRWPKNLIPKS